MSSDPASAMLRAYEEGHAASPGERGLILLGVAVPELSDAARREMPVGRRDAALIDLHIRWFGAVAEAVADCPSCGERLEIDVPLPAIRLEPPALAAGHFVLPRARGDISFRLPSAGDLAALGAEAAVGDAASAMSRLARRCVVSGDDALREDEEAALVAAVAEAVAHADPQAEVLLALDCPACGHSWRAPFDIVEFTWRRVESVAIGLLREVHLIASRYGWSERDIIALGPFRRRRYLELIGA